MPHVRTDMTATTIAQHIYENEYCTAGRKKYDSCLLLIITLSDRDRFEKFRPGLSALTEILRTPVVGMRTRIAATFLCTAVALRVAYFFAEENRADRSREYRLLVQVLKYISIR